GLITIGQSPRDDVVPEMLAQLGFEVEAIQLGAIDGLSLEEVRELAPRGDEPWAVSRLRDGTEVRLAKRELDPRMQRCVDAVEAGRLRQCEAAGRLLADGRADLVYMSCMGHTRRMRSVVREVSGRPTITANGVIAGLIAQALA